jgi:hypothetical protein
MPITIVCFWRVEDIKPTNAKIAGSRVKHSPTIANILMIKRLMTILVLKAQQV